MATHPSSPVFIDQLLTAAYQRSLVAGLVAALRREPQWLIANFRPIAAPSRHWPAR